jgi:hypothetical protein
MVGELAARHALSKDIIEGVSERTGGAPLFIEEVTRLLLERGEQGGAQAIPLTLRQSLAARLDRLGVARETIFGNLIRRRIRRDQRDCLFVKVPNHPSLRWSSGQSKRAFEHG